MIQWTTYDGTKKTLPPNGVPIIGIFSGVRCCVIRKGRDYIVCGTESLLRLGTLVGDKWLIIPTEAQLAALAEVVEVVEVLEELAEPGEYPKHPSDYQQGAWDERHNCASVARRALAKLKEAGL